MDSSDKAATGNLEQAALGIYKRDDLVENGKMGENL